MGIGLVDPTLPAISNQLHASPSETTLLFTSYLVVTAVAMLITNWVSSRIGAKWTLIAGLVLIVAFAGLAGSSNSIGTIIGFRAGWGVGNALFIGGRGVPPGCRAIAWDGVIPDRALAWLPPKPCSAITSGSRSPGPCPGG
jgi:MFS family permease